MLQSIYDLGACGLLVGPCRVLGERRPDEKISQSQINFNEWCANLIYAVKFNLKKGVLVPEFSRIKLNKNQTDNDSGPGEECGALSQQCSHGLGRGAERTKTASDVDDDDHLLLLAV